MEDGNGSNNDSFENIFIKVLNKHAPVKILRANHVPNLTKTLSKTIMRRPQLERKHLKTKTKGSFKEYKEQKSFCSKLYLKERKRHYNTQVVKKGTDNRKFWKTLKPFLSDKHITTTQITKEYNNKVISSHFELSEEFE